MNLKKLFYRVCRVVALGLVTSGCINAPENTLEIDTLGYNTVLLRWSPAWTLFNVPPYYEVYYSTQP